MTDSPQENQTHEASAVLRIYTNELDLERARQESAAGEKRLPTLRNRVARGKGRALTVLAIVAKERKDNTIEKEARERLVELGVLAKGQPISEIFEVVPSRRASHSKVAQAAGVAVEPETSNEQVASETAAEVAAAIL